MTPSYSDWKRSIDERIDQSMKQLKKVRDDFPVYSRSMSWQPDHSQAFIPIPDDANGDVWRTRITFLQLAVKDTRIDSRDVVQAFNEWIKFTQGFMQVMIDAYDIQGRVILAASEKVGVDFDQLIADFAIAKNEKGIEYVQSAPSFSEDKETPETVEKDSAHTLPW